MAIKLVDAKLILHVFDGRDEFEAYCTQLGLKRSNMNELLAGGGCGVREDTDASFKYGHALLSKLRWIKSDSEIHIPVISYDHAIKTLKDLGYALDRTKLKNLCLRRSKQIKELDDSNNVLRVWTLASQPSVVSSLQDGASLLDLVEQPVQTTNWSLGGASGEFGAQAETAVTSGAGSSSPMYPDAGILAPAAPEMMPPSHVHFWSTLTSAQTQPLLE